MLPNKLNFYLSLCLLVLVTFMTGAQANAMSFVSNTHSSTAHEMNHNGHGTLVQNGNEQSADKSTHCASLGHHEHSEQCGKHSLNYSGCGDNVCSGGVIGALFSTTFIIASFSHPQYFYSLEHSKHQGYPTSLYRPPIA